MVPPPTGAPGLPAGTLDPELERACGACARLDAPASGDGRGLVWLRRATPGAEARGAAADGPELPDALHAELLDAGLTVLALELSPDAPDRAVCALAARALEHLGERPGLEADRVGLLGAREAGVWAFLTACTGRGCSALVGVDVDLVRERLDEAHPFQPLEMALNLDAPMLAVYGGTPPEVPRGSRDLLRERLAAFARSLDEHAAPGDPLDDPHARGAILHFLDAILV